MQLLRGIVLLACVGPIGSASGQAIEARESWIVDLAAAGMNAVGRVEVSAQGWVGLSDPATGRVMIVDPSGTIRGSAQISGGRVVGWTGDTLHVVAAGGASIVALSTAGKALGITAWRPSDMDRRYDSLRSSGLERPSLVAVLDNSGFALRYLGPSVTDTPERHQSTPGTALSVIGRDGRSGLLATAPRAPCEAWIPAARRQLLLVPTPFCGASFVLPAPDGGTVGVVSQDQSAAGESRAVVEFYIDGDAAPTRHLIRRPTIPISPEQYATSLDSPIFAQRGAEIAKLPRPASTPLVHAALIDRHGTVWLELRTTDGPQQWLAVSAVAGETTMISVPRSVMVRAATPGGFAATTSGANGPTLHWYSITR